MTENDVPISEPDVAALRKDIGPRLSISRFVRAYLKRYGRSHAQELHRIYKEMCVEEKKHTPEYASVRVIIHMLRRSGLVRNAGSGPAQPVSPKTKLKERRVYIEIVPGTEHHRMWEDVWVDYKERRGAT